MHTPSALAPRPLESVRRLPILLLYRRGMLADDAGDYLVDWTDEWGRQCRAVVLSGRDELGVGYFCEVRGGELALRMWRRTVEWSERRVGARAPGARPYWTCPICGQRRVALCMEASGPVCARCARRNPVMRSAGFTDRLWSRYHKLAATAGVNSSVYPRTHDWRSGAVAMRWQLKLMMAASRAEAAALAATPRVFGGAGLTHRRTERIALGCRRRKWARSDGLDQVEVVPL